MDADTLLTLLVVSFSCDQEVLRLSVASRSTGEICEQQKQPTTGICAGVLQFSVITRGETAQQSPLPLKVATAGAYACGVWAG